MWYSAGMAQQSTMLPLGTPLPQFSLSDVLSGQIVSSETFKGKPALVMFICRHCPFVKHVQGELAKLGKDYAGRVNILAISSNDIQECPDDSPQSLKKQAEEVGFNFPYLYDEAQDVAKSFTAACTPDFFLFDREGKLVYRGQLDDSRPSLDIPVTGKDLREAIEALLSGQPINPNQKPSVGCGIKWKE